MKSPLTLLSDGHSFDHWLYPTFPPDLETPDLEEGERPIFVVQSGSAEVEVYQAADKRWHGVWSPPEAATTTVTDRRIVLGCREYTRGSTYAGFGAGAVLALGATAVSRARARKARQGKCMGLQLRYEWTSHVLLVTNPAGWQGRLARVAGMPEQRVGIVAWDRGNMWRLIFGSRGPGADGELAGAMVRAIAWIRLSHPELLDEQQAALIQDLTDSASLRSAPGETSSVYIPAARSIGFRPNGPSATSTGQRRLED